MKKLTFKHTVLACYLTYITSAVSNNLVPLLFVTFNRQFGLELDQLAFIITMNFGIQIFVDLAGAKYADRIGYKKLIMIAQLFDAVGLIGLGTLPSLLPYPYVGIIASVLLYAIGSGLTEVVISPIIEAIPGDAKASSMSLLHSFYCWGHVLMVVVTTLYFKCFGIENWSFICLFWAILPIINFFFYIFVPVAQLNDDGNSETMPLRKLLSKGIIWVFILLMLCSGAAEQAMSQWASFFAETELGVGKQVADLLGPCMFAIAMGIARVLFAGVGRKVDIRVGLLISAVLCVFSYLVAAFAPHSFLSLAGCALCGFAVGILWPGVLSLSAKTYPAGGTAMFGILALGGDMGCFVGPEVVARVSTALAGGGEPSVKTGLALAIVFPLIILLASGALLAGDKIRKK